MTWLFFAQQMEREDKQHEELSRLSSQLYTYMEKVSSFSFSFNTFLSILPPNEPSLAASLRNFLFDRGNKGTQFQSTTISTAAADFAKILLLNSLFLFFRSRAPMHNSWSLRREGKKGERKQREEGA